MTPPSRPARRPTRLRLASCNLNWSRGAGAQHTQLEHVKLRGIHADVIAAQECEIHGTGNRFTGIRPYQEALYWRRDLPVKAHGHHRYTDNNRGEAIGPRQLVWLEVMWAGPADAVTVIDVHMPPLRMRRTLYPVCAAALHRLLARTRYPWVVGGDWNHLIARDPAGLRRRYGAHWFGQRIDGWAVHPRLAPFVAADRAVMDPPSRPDRHPTCYLVLDADNKEAGP